MIPRFIVTLLEVLLLLATGGDAQSPRKPHLSMPDSCRPLEGTRDANGIWQRMLWSEEALWAQGLAARATEDLQRWLGDGLRDGDLGAQTFAVRALGRLERPELVSELALMLSSPWPAVRGEAADAIGQAVQGATAASRPEAMRHAAGLLRKRLGEEADATVRGVICATLGRLTYPDAAEAQAIERLLVDATFARASSGDGARGDATLAERLGASKGLESLLRQHVKLFRPADGTIARLCELALAQPDARGRRETGSDGDALRVRRLALMALAPHQAADEKTLAAALQDEQWEMRRVAVRMAGAGLRAAAGSASEARLALIRRALRDSDWRVRYEAVSASGRSQDAPECAALLRAAGDPSTHVALLAIDQLPRCQAAAAEAIPVLRRLARTLPMPDKAAGKAAIARPAWHRAAHALVTLARLAPDQAGAELGRFLTSDIWQVRMYAARTAAVLKAAQVLRQAADDPDDNVRNAAISGLSEIEQHGADDVYIAQLARNDGQLLMTAARALRGSSDPAAISALLAALTAQTMLDRDTSRDARLALLERIGELGSRQYATALQPFLHDFDPRVATSAATIMTKWTGAEPAAAGTPRVEAILSLTLEEVRRLDGARAVVRMKNGGTFTLALLTWQAPVTVAGFVRLVECGYYNGLTFHRVEPNFVVQGGSPGANEYAGYGRFMRDEVGLASNARGSVGLSTRGRNTGDGQWYVNMADNARLDHSYTVFAMVVNGMDVVDSILEGDQIQEVRIVGARKSTTVSYQVFPGRFNFRPSGK